MTTYNMLCVLHQETSHVNFPQSARIGEVGRPPTWPQETRSCKREWGTLCDSPQEHTLPALLSTSPLHEKVVRSIPMFGALRRHPLRLICYTSLRCVFISADTSRRSCSQQRPHKTTTFSKLFFPRQWRPPRMKGRYPILQLRGCHMFQRR